MPVSIQTWTRTHAAFAAQPNSDPVVALQGCHSSSPAGRRRVPRPASGRCGPPEPGPPARQGPQPRPPRRRTVPAGGRCRGDHWSGHHIRMKAACPALAGPGHGRKSRVTQTAPRARTPNRSESSGPKLTVSASRRQRPWHRYCTALPAWHLQAQTRRAHRRAGLSRTVTDGHGCRSHGAIAVVRRRRADSPRLSSVTVAAHRLERRPWPLWRASTSLYLQLAKSGGPGLLN